MPGQEIKCLAPIDEPIEDIDFAIRERAETAPALFAGAAGGDGRACRLALAGQGGVDGHVAAGIREDEGIAHGEVAAVEAGEDGFPGFLGQGIDVERSLDPEVGGGLAGTGNAGGEIGRGFLDRAADARAEALIEEGFPTTEEIADDLVPAAVCVSAECLAIVGAKGGVEPAIPEGGVGEPGVIEVGVTFGAVGGDLAPSSSGWAQDSPAV